MSQLVMAREVYCPIERAFGYVADLERTPEWWPNVLELHALDGGPPGAAVGRRYSLRYSMLGRQVPGLLTVDEVTAPTRLRFSVEGQLRAHLRWEITATARTRTRLIVSVEYSPPSLIGRAFDALVVEKRNRADGEHALDSLKALLEAEAIARMDAGVV